MTGQRQGQRSGDNSKQYQAAGDIHIHEHVHAHGVTEERAFEIAHAIARQVILDHAVAGQATIEARLREMDQRTVALLADHQKLEVFADPSFQRTYGQAQTSAAATEREADFDTLATLLLRRSETMRDRIRGAWIDRAIGIVDQIDSEALRLLAVMRILTSHPLAGDRVEASLNAWNNRLSAATGVFHTPGSVPLIHSRLVSPSTRYFGSTT